MLEVVNAGESDNLKIIVTQKVIDVIGLTDENLPERVKSWIHQICLPYTAGISPKKFTGKLADSIDLVSLPNRKRL